MECWCLEMADVSSLLVPLPNRPVRAVSPRLRKLLNVIFALVALLGANAAYLCAITGLEWTTGHSYQNYFYQLMFLGHLLLGLVLVLPFLVFGVLHMIAARKRRQRRAVRIGYALFIVGIIALATGLLLMRIDGFDLKQPLARRVIYWLHFATPLAAIWLYWLHRLAGPRIKWKVGLAYAGVVAGALLLAVSLHSQDPRDWNQVGPASGVKYFEPSLARTASGDFIPEHALINDAYCKTCHADVHAAWSDSAHRFSSFNNPMYLASVMETRQVSLDRDGSVQASRWCAGCHDPVPFFSGAFDNPKFDVIHDPTASAGITCSVCHSITHVNSAKGNADYTIEAPSHYPFAYSENSTLQWVNRQLVKAKPAFHKQTFLKPFHKTAEFCSTCHKVSLPKELTHYKDFLRGQNHYDSYLLSGVSGHGLRSFYYPPKAQQNCNGCHMPLEASQDFGAGYFGTDTLSVHDHLFPAANTGVAWMRDDEETIRAHQEFLTGAMRVDIFGIREGGKIDDPLIAPLRPEAPILEPGKNYLLEVVIRTLTLGHLFTQGTGDSNEVWLEIVVRAGDEIIGRSGGLESPEGGEVDPWSHFVNVFMLDKEGRRIDRRNPQDIFTPLYNHQIPPGAGQTVHYELNIPESVTGPITVEARLNYRKFDQKFMDFVAQSNAKLGQPIRGDREGEPYLDQLPITVLARDQVNFAVGETGPPVTNKPVEFPLWQRWNDYGIGLLLSGKNQLRQAQEAFQKVEELERWDGPMNLARAYNEEGLIDDAAAALQRATKYRDEKGYPFWTWAWLSGVTNRQQGRFEEAVKNLRAGLGASGPDIDERGFDFQLDYTVINLLGETLFDQGTKLARQNKPEEAEQTWREAVAEFQKVLKLDSENATAHHNLQRLYTELGDAELAAKHEELHLYYKPDDTAQSRAIRLARSRYPAANHASESVVIYPLRRPDSLERYSTEKDTASDDTE